MTTTATHIEIGTAPAKSGATMTQSRFANLEEDIQAIITKIEAGTTEIETGMAMIEVNVEARIAGCKAGTDNFEAGVAEIEANMAQLRADAEILLERVGLFVKAERARIKEANRAREKWEAGRAWYTFPNGLGCITEDDLKDEGEFEGDGGKVGSGV